MYDVEDEVKKVIRERYAAPQLERNHIREDGAFSFTDGQCSSLVEELSADDLDFDIVREMKLARTFRRSRNVDRQSLSVGWCG